MNQTEKVAKRLFENEQERSVEDWDSIRNRPLWEKVVKRYLAKAKEILDIIDQQGEPVKNLSTKVGSLSDKKAEPVAWATLNTVDEAMQYTTERPGPLARLPEWPERAADGWCVCPLVYLHPPASREVGDFEPWMVEFLEGNLYALPPSIRTKSARERWREVANARIAAAISRLFEEVGDE